jgi:hypothetical protein
MKPPSTFHERIMATLANETQTQRKLVPRIYVPIGILTLVFAFLGFWASYYGPLLAGRATTPAIIQFHAAVFVGWLCLVIAQAAFAGTHRIALHRRVGRYVMLYGAFVATLGVVASFASFGRYVQNGDVQRADSILFIGLTDMLTFIPFLLGAWWYRARPEVHKRLIVVATTVLLIAPVHRMHWFLGGPPAPVAYVLLIWLAPIYLAMIHDLITRRIVHPVYLLGIVAVIYMKFWRTTLHESESWSNFSQWLVTLYSG